MDSSHAIEATDLSKKYRLGTIGMTSLREDLSRWWTRKKQNVSTEKNVKTAGIDQSRMINDSEFWALDDLNFKILKGEVVGLIGANGSGKSTTIKVLLGLLNPSRGVARIFGRSPRDVKTKERIGYLPEESYLYRYLNSAETLDFFGGLFALNNRGCFNVLISGIK